MFCFQYKGTGKVIRVLNQVLGHENVPCAIHAHHLLSQTSHYEYVGGVEA
jgi:hypothetical protein